MNDKTIRVLSIEDNPADAELIQEKLAEAQRVGWDLPRFEVEHVARLQSALGRLDDSDRFDVVLSDLDLPDSRAGETVAALREHIPQMPLVVLTGREDEALARNSVRAGVQDYLYKNEATGSLLARTMMYAIERQRSKQALQGAHDAMERRVDKRTAELRKSKQALQRERDKAERYLNIAPAIIVALDAEGCITLLNELGAEILACDQADVIGRNWFDTFLPEGIREEVKAVFDQLMDDDVQPVEYVEGVVLTGQGKERIIRWHNTVLKNERGEITGVLSAGQDITKRKRAEKERKRYIRELQIITDTITTTSRMENTDQMCEFLGKTIQDVNEEAYVIVSLYDRELDAIRVRAMVGDGETFERVFGQFGDDLADVLAVPLSDLDEQTRPYATGKLERIPGGLYALLGGKVPQETCRKVEDEANISAVYAVGFALEDKPYGGISILVPQGEKLQYSAVIETLASHFSVVIQRRQAEEALRQSEEQYSVLFESFPLGITVADSDGQILEANAESERLLGISRDEHAARQIDGEEWRIIRPDGSPMPAEEYASVRALQENRLIEDVEMGIIRPDSEITWISVTAAPLEDDRVVITYNDVTRRHQMEDALKESEERFRVLFKTMTEGVALHEMVYDEAERPIDYVILEVNPAYETQTGLAGESVIGERASDVYGTDTPPYLDTYAQMAETGQPVEFEVNFTPLDKHFRISAFSPAEGQFATVFEDITERKRTEEALRESRQWLSTTLRSIGDAVIATDERGQVRLMNPVAEDLTGWNEAEAVGEPLEDVFHIVNKRTGERVENPVDKVFCEGVIVGLANHTTLIAEDGTRYSIADSAAPIKDQDGAIIGAVLVFRDVTERRRAEEALRESEAFLQTVYEHSPVGFFVVEVTAEGDYVYQGINPAHEEIIGISDDFLQGKSPRVLEPDYGKDVVDYILDLYDTCVQQRSPLRIEEEVDWGDETISLLTQITPLFDEKGDVYRLIGAALDITGRKRTKEALRATRERYRSLFEETPVGLYRTTVSGEILEANPALVSMLGYQEREALLEADVLDFYLDPDDRKRNVGTSSTADDWESVEVRLRRKDGQIIWVRDTGRAVRDSEGQICHYDGALVDITERRRAEETLRQRNRELALLRRAGQAFDSSLDLKQVLATVLEETRRLLDVVACSVWLVDPDTDELVCWQATGPRREVVRDWRLAPGVGVAGQVVRHGESFIVSDTRTDERYFAGVAQEAGLDLRSVLAVPLRVKEGVIGVLEMVDVEVDGFTLDDMLLGEQLAASAAIAIENARLYEQAQQEIAERKRAEKEIERYAAELERSNRDLQQFAYAVSHDLQEPLRVSTSYLRLLEERYDDQLDDRADKYIGKAVSSAERMKAMINALLDLSRVGTRGEEPAPADAEEVLKRILGSLERAIEDANAKVTHDPLPTVMADEAQLAQIFQNLIANAIKFRHEGKRPHVHISAGREGDEWLFSVADNGIGIDPEQVDRIFQIFQRLHTEEEYPGLGMGLALCKRIVERHGGRIWVASKVGHGSTFTFTLPARPKA
jgi:PAS domain S-box-containing protein